MADAAEKKARYACLVDRGGRELLFEDIARTTEHNPREVGTHDEAAYYAGTFARGASVVRILEDGEHEAAIARAEKAEARAKALQSKIETLAGALEEYGIADAFIERFMDEANIVTGGGDG